MNKALADGLEIVNAISAVLIVFGCGIVGAISLGVWGFIIGCMIGFFLSILVCGVIAILCDIRRLLIDQNKS